MGPIFGLSPVKESRVKTKLRQKQASRQAEKELKRRLREQKKLSKKNAGPSLHKSAIFAAAQAVMAVGGVDKDGRTVPSREVRSTVMSCNSMPLSGTPVSIEILYTRQYTRIS